ncbi:MAG: integrase core domain-containing protein [Anaerolineae bacterium]|nr:integrase core domain-containing protein [Anaerolineae bacterium]
MSETVVARILELRDQPPEGLNRVPGPRTIRYYLEQDEALRAQGETLPRSTRTIWKVLCQHQRIYRAPRADHQPVERPAPLTIWEADFKDVTTVPPDPEGKQLHMVEVFNVVDAGTSILLNSLARTDFNAETALLAFTDTFMQHGLPQAIRLDRDPRFVGSWRAHDFPSPVVRFLNCLGVTADICPPQRPDKKPFVERFHRTLEYECLQVYKPADVAQTQDIIDAYGHFYNHDRPNQALTCGNQPPRKAHPTLSALPRLPERVDPDRWLWQVEGKRFKRQVKAGGSVQVDKHDYSISQKLRGRYVVLKVDARQREFIVELADQVVKRIPIKGLYNEALNFETYLALMRREALSDWRRWQHATRQRRYTS